jgi:Tfp pilus assembly protein PilF
MRHATAPAILAALTILCGCASSPKAATQDELQAARADATRLSSEGLAFQREGKLDEAIASYRKAIAAFPELPGVRNNLGAALIAKREYLEASDVLKEESLRSLSDPRPLVNLGILYMDRGWAQDSHEYFKRALERDPNNIDALRGAIETARRLGREDQQTLDLVNRAILLEKDTAWHTDFQLRKIRLEQVLSGKAMTDDEAVAREVNTRPRTPAAR